MQSVFEQIGIKKQAKSTSIPQLGVKKHLSMLQIESQNYFTIPKAAQAADNDMLAVEVVEGQTFLSTNQAHVDFLNQCTALVNEKSTQLKRIDQKLLASVIFGVAATALSYFPLVGFLGWIGWGAAIYYMNQRAVVYAEYHESLTLLVGACNWSLGPGVTDRKDTIENLAHNPSIRNMMVALYPVLTETQVKHLIADDIENVFTNELEEYESKFKLGFEPNRFFSNKDERIALSKKGAEFSRCIYGFNKGNVSDLLDAIVSSLPDLYKAVQHSWQRLKYWWQEKSHPAPKEEKPEETVTKSI